MKLFLLLICLGSLTSLLGRQHGGRVHMQQQEHSNASLSSVPPEVADLFPDFVAFLNGITSKSGVNFDVTFAQDPATNEFFIEGTGSLGQDLRHGLQSLAPNAPSGLLDYASKLQTNGGLSVQIDVAKENPFLPPHPKPSPAQRGGIGRAINKYVVNPAKGVVKQGAQMLNKVVVNPAKQLVNRTLATGEEIITNLTSSSTKGPVDESAHVTPSNSAATLLEKHSKHQFGHTEDAETKSLFGLGSAGQADQSADNIDHSANDDGYAIESDSVVKHTATETLTVVQNPLPAPPNPSSDSFIDPNDANTWPVKGKIAVEGKMRIGFPPELSQTQSFVGFAVPNPLLAHVEIGLPIQLSPTFNSNFESMFIRAIIGEAIQKANTPVNGPFKWFQFDFRHAFLQIAGWQPSPALYFGTKVSITLFNVQVDLQIYVSHNPDQSLRVTGSLIKTWDKVFNIPGLRAQLDVEYVRGADGTKSLHQGIGGASPDISGAAKTHQREEALRFCGTLALDSDPNAFEPLVDVIRGELPKQPNLKDCLKRVAKDASKFVMSGIFTNIQDEDCSAFSVSVVGDEALKQLLDRIHPGVSDALFNLVSINNIQLVFSSCPDAKDEYFQGVVPILTNWDRNVLGGLNFYADVQLSDRLSHFKKWINDVTKGVPPRLIIDASLKLPNLGSSSFLETQDTSNRTNHKHKHLHMHMYKHGHKADSYQLQTINQDQLRLEARIRAMLNIEFCEQPPCAKDVFMFKFVGLELGGSVALGPEFEGCIFVGARFGLQVPKGEGQEADQLRLYGEGELCINPVDLFSLRISAGLLTNGGWKGAFGLDWLTVYNMGFSVKLSAAAAARYAIPLDTLAGFGSLAIGDAQLILKFSVSGVNPNQSGFEGQLRRLHIGDLIGFVWEKFVGAGGENNQEPEGISADTKTTATASLKAQDENSCKAFDTCNDNQDTAITPCRLQADSEACQAKLDLVEKNKGKMQADSFDSDEQIQTLLTPEEEARQERVLKMDCSSASNDNPECNEQAVLKKQKERREKITKLENGEMCGVFGWGCTAEENAANERAKRANQEKIKQENIKRGEGCWIWDGCSPEEVKLNEENKKKRLLSQGDACGFFSSCSDEERRINDANKAARAQEEKAARIAEGTACSFEHCTDQERAENEANKKIREDREKAIQIAEGRGCGMGQPQCTDEEKRVNLENRRRRREKEDKDGQWWNFGRHLGRVVEDIGFIEVGSSLSSSSANSAPSTELLETTTRIPQAYSLLVTNEQELDHIRRLHTGLNRRDESHVEKLLARHRLRNQHHSHQHKHSAHKHRQDLANGVLVGKPFLDINLENLYLRIAAGNVDLGGGQQIDKGFAFACSLSFFGTYFSVYAELINPLKGFKFGFLVSTARRLKEDVLATSVPPIGYIRSKRDRILSEARFQVVEVVRAVDVKTCGEYCDLQPGCVGVNYGLRSAQYMSCFVMTTTSDYDHTDGGNLIKKDGFVSFYREEPVEQLPENTLAGQNEEPLVAELPELSDADTTSSLLGQDDKKVGVPEVAQDQPQPQSTNNPPQAQVSMVPDSLLQDSTHSESDADIAAKLELVTRARQARKEWAEYQSLSKYQTGIGGEMAVSTINNELGDIMQYAPNMKETFNKVQNIYEQSRDHGSNAEQHRSFQQHNRKLEQWRQDKGLTKEELKGVYSANALAEEAYIERWQKNEASIGVDKIEATVMGVYNLPLGNLEHKANNGVFAQAMLQFQHRSQLTRAALYDSDTKFVDWTWRTTFEIPKTTTIDALINNPQQDEMKIRINIFDRDPTKFTRVMECSIALPNDLVLGDPIAITLGSADCVAEAVQFPEVSSIQDIAAAEQDDPLIGEDINSNGSNDSNDSGDLNDPSSSGTDENKDRYDMEQSDPEINQIEVGDGSRATGSFFEYLNNADPQSKSTTDPNAPPAEADSTNISPPSSPQDSASNGAEQEEGEEKIVEDFEILLHLEYKPYEMKAMLKPPVKFHHLEFKTVWTPWPEEVIVHYDVEICGKHMEAQTIRINLAKLGSSLLSLILAIPWEDIADWFGKLWTELIVVAEKLIDLVKELVEDFVDGIKSFLKALCDAFQMDPTQFVSDMHRFWDDEWDRVVEETEEQIENDLEEADEMEKNGDGLGATIKRITTVVYNKGAQAVQGIIGNIGKGTASIIGFVFG